MTPEGSKGSNRDKNPLNRDNRRTLGLAWIGTGGLIQLADISYRVMNHSLNQSFDGATQVAILFAGLGALTLASTVPVEK